MKNIVNDLLSSLGIHPVLVDIGAGGALPQIWDRIASSSIYMGFEPNEKEIPAIPTGRFYKEIMVNKAVTCDPQKNSVLFYLTKSPACSSTLRPDEKSLANFLFYDLFTVEREAVVGAATFDSILASRSLPCVDWFKTDSQGTDLRLFNSLKDEIRSRVLAVDIEPGLIDAYIGEDLFVDVHRNLTQNGFWLSDLNIGTAVRMRKSTLQEVVSAHNDINYHVLENRVKKSPGWCEARYLRSLEWLAQKGFAKRDYILLWAFAFLDDQLGFALDIAYEYERIFGQDEIARLMKNEAIVSITQLQHKPLLVRVKSLIPGPIKQWLRKLLYQ